jgi:hypothetical protein
VTDRQHQHVLASFREDLLKRRRGEVLEFINVEVEGLTLLFGQSCSPHSRKL